jgi:hypothetical protein
MSSSKSIASFFKDSTSVGETIRSAGRPSSRLRTLLVTNQHVFNARDDDDPDANSEDFTRQALNTVVQLDIDSNDSGTEPIKILELVASDANLISRSRVFLQASTPLCISIGRRSVPDLTR